MSTWFGFCNSPCWYSIHPQNLEQSGCPTPLSVGLFDRSHNKKNLELSLCTLFHTKYRVSLKTRSPHWKQSWLVVLQVIPPPLAIPFEQVHFAPASKKAALPQVLVRIKTFLFCWMLEPQKPQPHSLEALGLLFLSVILDPLQGLTSYQPQPTLEPKEWWNIKHDRPLLLDKRGRRRKDGNLSSLASTSTNAIEYNQMHMFRMLKCTVDIQRNITNMYAN